MKKAMKKLGMVLSLAACMGMMMAGCGGNKNSDSEEQVYKIGKRAILEIEFSSLVV